MRSAHTSVAPIVPPTPLPMLPGEGGKRPDRAILTPACARARTGARRVAQGEHGPGRKGCAPAVRRAVRITIDVIVSVSPHFIHSDLPGVRATKFTLANLPPPPRGPPRTAPGPPHRPSAVTRTSTT